MLAYGVALFILWCTFLVFSQFLVFLAIGALAAFYYFLTQKYLLTKIGLKEGYYKVEITGMVSIPAYSTPQNSSFYLRAGFNSWNRQKIKVCFYAAYSYAFPFNATFFVESKKAQ